MGTVAIIGGTGKLGTALAARFARAGHTILIGSRDASRAAAAASALETRLGADPPVRVSGASNAHAAEGAEMVVIAVPYDSQVEILREMSNVVGSRVIISTAVPVRFDEHGPVHVDLAEGSATQQVAALLPGARVVGALHTVSSATLNKLDRDVNADIVVTGDDNEAKLQAADLLTALPGIRIIDGGALRNSRYVEQLTVLLLSINMHHRRNTGIRITNLPDDLALRCSPTTG